MNRLMVRGGRARGANFKLFIYMIFSERVKSNHIYDIFVIIIKVAVIELE